MSWFWGPPCHAGIPHFTGFGVSACLVLLSRPDRLSTWDRSSPISPFSFYDRVSIPNRLSLVVRLSLAERFSWSSIVCLRRLPRITVDGAYYQWFPQRGSFRFGLNSRDGGSVHQRASRTIDERPISERRERFRINSRNGSDSWHFRFVSSLHKEVALISQVCAETVVLSSYRTAISSRPCHLLSSIPVERDRPRNRRPA